MTAWPLVSHLFSLGYVTEGDYDRMANLRKQRNAAAHFRPGNEPSAAEVEYILTLVERMVYGQYASVDQMIEWYVDLNDFPDVPLSESVRTSIRRTLAEHFPGTPDPDLDEALDRLENDAAL